MSTVLVLIVAIALLIADQVWTWRRPVPRRLYLPRPRLGWTLRPGIRREIGLRHAGEFVWRHTIEINGHGFNDREWRTKPPGVKRVLVMGDSIVEGRQVARTGNFVARAEACLNRRGRYELLNVGIAGWSVDSVLNYFQQAGSRLEPDLVVLGLFVGNDLVEGDYDTFRYLFAYAWDCRRYDKPAFGLKDGRLGRSNFPAWRNVSARLFSVEIYERSRSFRLAYQRVNSVMERRRNGSRVLKARDVSYNTFMDQTKGAAFFHEQTEAQVDAMAAECRRANCSFGVMLEPNFPLFHSLADGIDPSSRPYQEFQRDVDHYREMHRRLSPKYPVLSLMEPLQAARSPISFRPADPHLNDDGHKLVGDLLADFIDRLGAAS